MKIKVGERTPDTEFFYMDENNTVQKIKSHLFFQDKKIIIIGVPGAFTKVCSSKHLPGYIDNYDVLRKKGVTKIICISVNDPNVMKAWGDQQKVQDKIFMAADPFCEFTKLIGADVDKSSKGLGIRSSRYTMLIENKIVKIIYEEKDTGICEVSAAENFIKKI